jgi:hypothetical protein
MVSQYRKTKCKLSNALLEDFHSKAWNALPDPELFKKKFMKECNRQWDIISQQDHIQNSFEYIHGNNPNAVGDLLAGRNLKPGDQKGLDYNLTKLQNLENIIKNVQHSIQGNEAIIHDLSGRTLLKDYLIVEHNFNVKMTTVLYKLNENVLKTMEECSVLLKNSGIFSENIRSGHGGRSVTGRIKKNTSHSKRKATKRKFKRLEENCQYISKNLCHILVSVEYLDLKNVKNMNDLLRKNNDQPTNTIDVSCVQTVGLKHNFVTFEAKCVILDNVCPIVEIRYWKLFENHYNVNGEHGRGGYGWKRE